MASQSLETYMQPNKKELSLPISKPDSSTDSKQILIMIPAGQRASNLNEHAAVAAQNLNRPRIQRSKTPTMAVVSPKSDSVIAQPKRDSVIARPKRESVIARLKRDSARSTMVPEVP